MRKGRQQDMEDGSGSGVPKPCGMAPTQREVARRHVASAVRKKPLIFALARPRDKQSENREGVGVHCNVSGRKQRGQGRGKKKCRMLGECGSGRLRCGRRSEELIFLRNEVGDLGSTLPSWHCLKLEERLTCRTVGQKMSSRCCLNMHKKCTGKGWPQNYMNLKN